MLEQIDAYDVGACCNAADERNHDYAIVGDFESVEAYEVRPCIS